jgi:WhiB family transcriptional regulator, redox-sensing transcriptional regulator
MSHTSRQVIGLAVPREHWRSLAACRFADPDLFFPISSSGPSVAQVVQAKAICAGCPVQRQCLAFALRTHQVHGVWGGLSEQERYPLRSATLVGVEPGHAVDVDTVNAADLRDDHAHTRAVAAAEHGSRSVQADDGPDDRAGCATQGPGCLGVGNYQIGAGTP